MGLAIDTIGFYRTAGTAADTALTAATIVPGDSFTIRSFGPTASASLRNIFQKSPHMLNYIRVRSPLMHDNVRGIAIYPGESPGQIALPPYFGQPLQSQDYMTSEILAGTASESVVCAMQVYYSDLLGAAARLHSWGDIAGNIKFIKPIEVDVAMGASAGVWVDTLITGTEDLTHANKDYAVLGFMCGLGVAAIGVKGGDTANLRVCGPGNVRQAGTSDYFVKLSNDSGLPCIPVINSANKGSTYLSVLSSGESATYKLMLMCAELINNLSN